MARDFRESGHLPKVRGDQGADPAELPRQRVGTTPQMHGRYPDYDALAQADHWDDLTRSVVLARVQMAQDLRFFTPAESSTLTAFCDRVMFQDSEPRIPLLAAIDHKLDGGDLDGFQYADMPSDQQTWRIVARALDEEAGAPAVAFADLGAADQDRIVGRFADGNVTGGSWAQVNVSRAWEVVTRSILSVFYAHPWAWSEIGFGGPAYPRGYARMGVGLSEAWEGDEAFSIDPGPDVQRKGG